MDSDWIQLRPGVMRKPLAVDDKLGVQADLIRLDANFTDREHTHDGFEWVYILEGGFTDEAGIHRKGDFVVNSTEGVHQVSTGPQGCLLLIFWTGRVSVTE